MKQVNLFALFVVCVLSGCATTQQSVYQQLGGQAKVAQIVDNFIYQIEFNAEIFEYFKDSNVQRFREKLNEHICVHTGGPCQYTGDSMEDVHTGMHITEAHFNLTVDLLINAMNDANVPHPLQNKVLAVFAPMRDEIYQR
ncbi:group I truncated hemoglobin [Catenovulum sediminis]|uniref:Group 1 truncated hemoglobin n=1 Tax=Catenovulum sediminis TaxID=1740262 RepID=A0ABV1RMN7_9ALTE|nr:group 1 truncated hemoglobin [Catenovulum sediminis]